MLARPELLLVPCAAETWAAAVVGGCCAAVDGAGVAASPSTTIIPFMLVTGLFFPVAVVPPWYTQ